MRESDNTTWRRLILAALDANGETWADVVSCTLDDAGLDFDFYGGFGGANGPHFCAWTADRVYFPLEYDGAEYAGSASRNPDGKPLGHQ